MRARSLGCSLAAVLTLATPLRAQEPPEPESDPEPTVAEPVATLSVWAEEMWISLLDRDGAWFGRLAAEGFLQRFNPLMDAEYELDVRSALFTSGEEARWAGVDNHLRAAGASISHPHVLNLVDWRQEVPVSGPVDVIVRYQRERSLTAQRDHPRLGVRWSDVLGTPWRIEAGLGVHFFKPSTDLELAVGRSWTGPGSRARWDVELGVADLDAFNTIIFKRLGVRREDVEAHLDYPDASPRAARLQLRHEAPRWRFEIHAGGTNRSEVAATFPSSDDVPFTQEEKAVFGGALLQVNPTPQWSVAAFATGVRADIEREVPESPPEGFTLREKTTAVGVRQRLFVTHTFAVEAEVDRTWRPEDREPVDGASVEHRDRTTFAQVALVRHPAAGWTGRIAWVLQNRDAGVLAPELEARNRRLVTALGYRFATGFEITAGAGWDLDAFDRRRFDGGHLRLAGTW